MIYRYDRENDNGPYKLNSRSRALIIEILRRNLTEHEFYKTALNFGRDDAIMCAYIASLLYLDVSWDRLLRTFRCVVDKKVEKDLTFTREGIAKLVEAIVTSLNKPRSKLDLLDMARMELLQRMHKEKNNPARTAWDLRVIAFTFRGKNAFSALSSRMMDYLPWRETSNHQM
jgi:hypothetical protein